MKKLNKIIQVLFIAMLCVGFVLPTDIAFAALNKISIGDVLKVGVGRNIRPIRPVRPIEPVVVSVVPVSLVTADSDSYSFDGDANAIVNDGTTVYVSDSNNKICTSDASDFSGAACQDIATSDVLYGLDYNGLDYTSGKLFTAAGKSDGASVGGLQVFYSSDLSTALSPYGTWGYTYSNVVMVGDTAYVAYIDDSYVPYLDAVSYDGSGNPIFLDNVSLNPTSGSILEDLSLYVSGKYAYVGIKDDGTGTDGGYLNVVDISDPSNMSLVGATLTYSDAVTSITAADGVFYVGHGTQVDIKNIDTFVSIPHIDVGSPVNGLTTNGTYLYVACDAGLKVYDLTNGNILVGEYNSSYPGTAVSVNEDSTIYLATSNGVNSEIFRIQMVTYTFGPDYSSYAEFGQLYDSLKGVEVNAGTLSSDVSEVDTSINGDVGNVIYSTDASPLTVTKEVEVRDTTGPVITLKGKNPQTVRLGSTYSETVDPGYTVTDLSGVNTISVDYSAVDTSKVGNYSLVYNACDNITPANCSTATRTVIVNKPSSSGGGSSTGGSTSGTEVGQVLGAEKFVFTMFLKMGHPPYPVGDYANEVMELQKFLNADPYNSGLVVDGKFGPLTNAAVIKFQLANGLVGDGLVGPLTRAVLNK